MVENSAAELSICVAANRFLVLFIWCRVGAGWCVAGSSGGF